MVKPKKQLKDPADQAVDREVSATSKLRPAEKAAVREVATELLHGVRSPSVTVSNVDGKCNLTLGEHDPAINLVLLASQLGSKNINFANSLVTQLGNACPEGAGICEAELNFALGVVAGIAPKDQLEALLAAQMAVVHQATMRQARRLAIASDTVVIDSAERSLNKLTRTFAAQLEALKKYRSDGRQRITVERVVVNDGGQAVVGVVERPAARGEG